MDFVNGEYGDYNVTYTQGEGVTDGYAKVVYDYDISNGYLAMVKNAISEGNVQSYFDINYKDNDGNILVFETPVRLLSTSLMQIHQTSPSRCSLQTMMHFHPSLQ